jgi:cytochrome P450
MGEAAAMFPPNAHPQIYLTAIARKYDLKGIFYVDLWPVADPQVVITDAALMDQTVVTRSLNQHPMANDFLEPIVGRDVIATANGAVWKKAHRAMAPAFSWSHIRSLTSVMIDECLHFRNTLDRLAATGEVFSMEKESAKVIFDIITRVVFNFSLNSQTSDSAILDDLHSMIKLAEAQLSFNPFTKLVAFFKRQIVLKRINFLVKSKIYERLNLLRREKIIPSRKDPFSILDLMLREQVEVDTQAGSDKIKATLPHDDLEQLITKYVFVK